MKQRIGVSILALLCFSGLSGAQAPTAVVNGQVRDTSGAAIAGATIEVFNDATHVRYATETNDEGIYSVPNLPPGTYHIQVSKQGFKTVVHPDITLNVQDAKAIGFTLPVGPISDTVTVEGGTPLINTESATVSTVVDRQFAENLPMNGRSFQTLIDLTPGVVITQSNNSDNGQFSANGQRAASNYWMVDGVSANVGVGGITPGNGFGGTLGTFSAFGGTNSLVSVDAMQEFRIQTSTYAPEFGRTPGAQISIATRSGTNQFHGTVFDYLRNDLFDANNWFNTSVAPPLPKAEERQNDFGGTVGGPIARDRAFFFFSYEGLRLRLPETALTRVPDTNPADPNSRQFATAAMQPFLNSFPLPNGPSLPAVPGAATLDATFSNPATLDAYSIRIDYRLSNKVSLFGRYNYSPSEIDQRGVGGEPLNDVTVSRITAQTATIGGTWVASPRFSNEFRFNYSRTNAKGSSYLDSFRGATPLTSLPFPGSFTDQNGQFTFDILGLGIGGRLLAGRADQNIQRQINITDSLTIQKGSHNLKLGVDFRRLTPMSAPPFYQQGAFFLNVPSADAGSSLFGFVFSAAGVTLSFRNLGVFAQDMWRVTPRLTATYGLRWDMDFSPSSLSGPSIPGVTGYSLTDFSQLSVSPAGTPPFNTTYGNVAPRIGLAYQVSASPKWATVLRGGFGVFYDLVSSETGNLIGFGFPPFQASNFVGGPFPYTAQQIAPVPIPANGTISRLYAFNPNLKLPYTLQWNIALDQALGKDQNLTASYVGSVGRRLLQTTEVSSPPSNPSVSTGLFIDNTAASSYHALQLQFRRRLSRGFQGLLSYVWSHSIDDGSTGSTLLVSNNGVPGSPNANRGASDFDIRNTFSGGFTYDLPSPTGNGFLKAIFGGWSTQNLIIARSGPPIDILDGNFAFSSCTIGAGIAAAIRPDLIAGKPLYLYGSQYPGGKAINPSAFTDPPVNSLTGCPQRQGNVPRNLVRGFGAAEWDLAVHRDFPIREAVKVQFRAEMFNVINHPNFGVPPNEFGFPGFGVATQMLGQSLNASNLGGGGFSSLYQIGGPRSVQFALKLFF